MKCLARLTDYNDNHPSIPNDFDKRYMQTYLKYVSPDKEETLVQYLGRDRNLFHFVPANGKPKFIIDWREYEDFDLSAYLPDIGYYNVGGKPIFLYKWPQKQYKRSFCASTYATTENRLANEAFWRGLGVETLNPKYAKLDEVKQDLFAFVALSRFFAIKKNEANEIYLLYRQYPVARLNFKDKVVEVIHQTLRQEIQDLFFYTGVREWNLQ